MTTDNPAASRAFMHAAGDPSSPTPVVDTESLFRGGKEVVITHKTDRYVLRITRHGKLILNK